jgi:hypothetical protein
MPKGTCLAHDIWFENLMIKLKECDPLSFELNFQIYLHAVQLQRIHKMNGNKVSTSYVEKTIAYLICSDL